MFATEEQRRDARDRYVEIHEAVCKAVAKQRGLELRLDLQDCAERFDMAFPPTPVRLESQRVTALYRPDGSYAALVPADFDTAPGYRVVYATLTPDQEPYRE